MIQAVTWLCAQAQALDKQIAENGAQSLGPLAGVPVAIKACLDDTCCAELVSSPSAKISARKAVC